MPLHTRRRVTEAVLNDISGLHSEPKAAVRKLTGPKKKKKNSLKLIKAYRKMSELWQTVCKNIVISSVRLLVLLSE